MAYNRRQVVKALGATAAVIAIESPLTSAPVVSNFQNSSIDTPQLFNIGHGLNPATPIRDELRKRLALLGESNGKGKLEEHKQKLTSDQQDLNLVFPVGGANGVVPAGMASALLQYSALEQLKNNPQSIVTPGSHVFNKFIAGSAGDFNAVYTSSGQTEGIVIYYHFLPKPEFMNTHRFPFMSLDYIFDVMRNDVPLHINDVLSTDAPKLEIRATAMPGRTPVKLTDFGNRDELFQAIRASAKQPLNGLIPVKINGQKLIDAGFSDPFCLEGPSKDTSNTKYVLFSNLPQDAPDPTDWKLYTLDIIPGFPSKGKLIEALHRARKLRAEMVEAGRLLVLYPTQTIKSTDTNPAILESGAKDGMQTFCRSILGQTPTIKRSMERLPEGNYKNLVPIFRLQF